MRSHIAATSSINIVVDIWILVLPISTLLKVKRPGREKLALIGIFSLGIFSCIASIVRLHSIRIYTESEDPFFDSVPINLWSMIEVNMGILCASVPALKALFSKSQRERTQTSNGAYQYHSRERSGTDKMFAKASSSGNGLVGTVIQNEAYGLKPVANGAETDTPKESHGGGAWLVSDSEVDEQPIIHPNDRV